MDSFQNTVAKLVDNKDKENKIFLYLDKLRELNAGINLTNFDKDSLNDSIIEAIFFAKYLSNYKSIMDIGSGNGIPGIIVAILLEGTEIILVEKKKKKAIAMEYMVYKLGLNNVKVINSDVRDILKDIHPEVFTSKAFCSLENFYSLLENHLTSTNRAICLKGANINEEIFILNEKKCKITSKQINNDNYVLKKDSYIVEFTKI